MILDPCEVDCCVSLAHPHFDQPSHSSESKCADVGPCSVLAPEVSWLVGLSHPLAAEYHSDSFAIKDCEPVPALVGVRSSDAG